MGLYGPHRLGMFGQHGWWASLPVGGGGDPGDTGEGTLLWEADFDAISPTSTMTQGDIDTVLGSSTDFVSVADHCAIVSGASGNYMRCLMDANAIQNTAGPQIHFMVPGLNHTHASLKMDIMFDGFTDLWGWGGKLTGFFGRNSSISDSDMFNQASGGSSRPDAMSARMMWIGSDPDGTGGYAKDPADLVTYAYLEDETGNGDNQWWGLNSNGGSNSSAVGGALQPDTWYTVEQEIDVVNDISRGWIDGTLVLDQTTDWAQSSITLRALQINAWRGGGNSDWEVSSDTWIRYGRIAVATGGRV